MDEQLKLPLGKKYGLFRIDEDYCQLTVDEILECGVIFDSEITAEIIVRLLNQLMDEKEHYRTYALKYLMDYDLYSDEFLETLKSIEGEETINGIRKNQRKVIEMLKKEGLFEEEDL